MSIPRPDAEAAWIAWLSAGGFQASTRIPRDHFNGMTRISRIGGKRLNPVQDKAQLLIETWDQNPYMASQKAHDLAERIEAAGDGTLLDPTTRVSEVSTTGPIEFPDNTSPLYRYQFTAESRLRRVAG